MHRCRSGYADDVLILISHVVSDMYIYAHNVLWDTKYMYNTPDRRPSQWKQVYLYKVYV